MAISAVQASKNVYDKYFEGRGHWNNAKGKDNHKSFDGLFRAAIDCINPTGFLTPPCPKHFSPANPA